MNRPGILKAAYYAVLAVGDDPSRRSVQAMCKQICGTAFHTTDVLDFLAIMRAGTTSVPPRVPQTERKESVSVPVPVPSHAGVAKVLESETSPQDTRLSQGKILAVDSATAPALFETASTSVPKAKRAAKAPVAPKAPRPPYEPPECPYDDAPIPTDDLTVLREIAVEFVALFANARDEKATKYLDTYQAVLVKAAARRRSIVETWDAFGRTRQIAGGKPLFGGLAFRALDLLPFRSAHEAMPGEDAPPPRGESARERAAREFMDNMPTALEVPDAPGYVHKPLQPWERPPFHPEFIAWRAANPTGLIPV